jgi:hypothetical protein
MNFPNLHGSSDFPKIDNVRVFNQYKNAFDYTRWKADTKLLLCSVPWDGNNNVVKFENDDKRNEYFNNATGYRDTLQTEMRILPDGMIKVPVPFDGSGLFNYCWVTFPIAPTADRPLDYEPTNGVRHWGFFIDDLKFRSPSCTELQLSVDWWTTFINDVSVKSMQLNRGHYALSHAANVADYLSDPHSHTAWLKGTEPESVDTRITNVKLSYLLNDNAPYLVFDVGSVAEDGSFSDGVPARPYHYKNVSGFPSGSMLAVALPDADAFSRNASAGFWQCVRAAYVVPGKWLALGDTETVGGVRVRQVLGGIHVTQDCKLTAADFNYDKEYAGLTKLYTSPYAYVHLVSDSGQDIMIAPETLGSTQTLEITSEITAAGARILSYLNGLGSSDVSHLVFQNMNSNKFSQSGAWQKTLMKWEISAFAIYQSSAEYNNYTKQWSREQARANASVAQINANASASTAQVNATASASTARTNAVASASTAQVNATASADTAKTNVDASANTSANNTYRSTANAVTCAANNAGNIIANNATSVGANSAIVATSNANAMTGAGYSNAKLKTDVQYDIGNMNANFDSEQAYLATSQANNNAQAATQGVTGIVNGAVSTIASALTGNIMGAVGSAVSTVTGAMNQGASWGATNAAITISMSNNVKTYNQSVTSAYGKQDASLNFTTNSTSLNNSTTASNAATQNNASTTIANRNAALTNTNARNTQSAQNANATDSANMTKSNASRTQDLTKDNASRSYNATVGNAKRSSDTLIANAQRSYNTSVANAKRNYDNSIAAVNNGILTDNAGAPHTFGTVANAENTAIKPAEVQIKVERACDDDIARCGDSFYRYGYACSRNIGQFSDFNIMKHFTYWQADEVWMRANNNAPENAILQIRDILETGTTVWRDPKEIGDVSIYDN